MSARCTAGSVDWGRLAARHPLGFIPRSALYEAEVLEHGEGRQLRDRIQQFSDTLLRVGSIRSERDREMIRSVGVNLFVSVEHFIEQLVSYNTWLLGSDHFLNDFAYERRSALSAVPHVLGPELQSGDVQLRWDAEGGNTLGTLLAYLRRAIAWIRGRDSTDRRLLERPVGELRHFIDSPEAIFRFRHTELWADADPDSLREYAAVLSAVGDQLNQANITAIRNGLDHKRADEDFPQVDAMLVCAARLREALDIADVQRLVPKTFWLTRRTADMYGRLEYTYEDYAGRCVTLTGPSMVEPLVQPRFSEPLLFAPGDLLADIGAELRFQVLESNAHTAYWRTYPRRLGAPVHREVKVNSGDGAADVRSDHST